MTKEFFQYVGLPMMRYTLRESEESGPGRAPIEGTHGEIVVCALPDCQQLFEVVKGIELVTSIEVFVIFSVAALNLAVMPGCVGLDPLVPDSQLGKFFVHFAAEPGTGPGWSGCSLAAGALPKTPPVPRVGSCGAYRGSASAPHLYAD